MPEKPMERAAIRGDAPLFGGRPPAVATKPGSNREYYTMNWRSFGATGAPADPEFAKKVNANIDHIRKATFRSRLIDSAVRSYVLPEKQKDVSIELRKMVHEHITSESLSTEQLIRRMHEVVSSSSGSLPEVDLAGAARAGTRDEAISKYSELLLGKAVVDRHAAEAAVYAEKAMARSFVSLSGGVVNEASVSSARARLIDSGIIVARGERFVPALANTFRIDSPTGGEYGDPGNPIPIPALLLDKRKKLRLALPPSRAEAPEPGVDTTVVDLGFRRLRQGKRAAPA